MNPLLYTWIALVSAPALGAPVRYVAEVRWTDAARLHEVSVESRQDNATFRQTLKSTNDGLQVELTPRQVEGDFILFSFRIQQNRAGKWVEVKAGELRARNGQRTHLMATDAKTGGLCELALLASTAERSSAADKKPARVIRL